jgi:hypothetical protein
MTSDPGNSDVNKPGGGDAPKPAAPAPAPPGGTPGALPARGPYLIVTPQAANPPARKPAEPLVDPVRVDVDAEPMDDEEAHEPILGTLTPGKPTYDDPTHHEPPRLVEPEPAALASNPPERPSPAPAPRPAPPRPNSPALKARSADRLAALNGPPPRRRGGCLPLLLILVILAGGGYFLWRAGKLDPLLTWAQPYTAPIIEKIRPVIDKIESLIPGHQAAAPAAESDEAMVLETKQLLLKLDFQPGPMNGTLDPATVAAIEAYQEAAGETVDGQVSQALLEELRGVANPTPN